MKQASYLKLTKHLACEMLTTQVASTNWKPHASILTSSIELFL